MATRDHTRFVPSRRSVLTGAVAALPAVPAFALPAVILPRAGLAVALQEHVDAIARTCAPFAARRGSPEWSFSASNYGKGNGGTLTLLMDGPDDDRGWPLTRRLEAFRVRDGSLDVSIFVDKEDGVYAYDVDFPV